jgi:outer membrane protein assembly factor BamB
MQHKPLRAFCFLLFLLPVLLLGSCESKAQLDAQDSQEGWPAFPPAADQHSKVRRTSEGQLQVPGAAFDEPTSRNATTVDDTCALQPGGEDDLAWAVYNVPGLTVERPKVLVVEIQALQPGGEDDLAYWIGLSNYSELRWEFKGPYTDTRQLTLNSAALRERYISADGTFSYVVLAQRRGSAGASEVRVNAGFVTTANAAPGSSTYFTNRPHFISAERVELGREASRASSAIDTSQQLSLSWTHVIDNGAEDNEAYFVRAYRRGINDKDRIAIGSVFSENEVYTDPVHNSDSAPDPVPGEKYVYYLRASNEDGWTPFSPGIPVTIPPDPPANVRATDGTYEDKIILTWEKSHGATGYEIYRDNQNAPKVTIGDVDTWEDNLIAEDNSPHIYWVVAVVDGSVRSKFSADELGYAGIPTRSNWYAFGGDSYHSGNLKLIRGPNANTQMWQYPSGLVFSNVALSSNNTSYFASQNGTVVSVNANGTESWTYPTASANYTTPAIDASGVLYVGGGDGQLYAINPDGTERWTVPISDQLSSPCFGLDGTLYTGSTGGFLFAIDPEDGDIIWTFDTNTDLKGPSNSIMSSPAVDDTGVIYFGCRNFCLYALRPDGTKYWRYPTGERIDSSPTIAADGSAIYIGSNDNSLHAVLPNGSNMWVCPTGDKIVATPALSPEDGTVYVGSMDDNFYAVDPADGSVKWSRPTGGDILGNAAVDGLGNVYVGSSDSKLYAYDKNGGLIWIFPVPGAALMGSVALGVDGSIFIPSSSGFVHRIGPGLGPKP